MSETIVQARPPACFELLCVCHQDTPAGAFDFVVQEHDLAVCEEPSKVCHVWQMLRHNPGGTFRILEPHPPHTHRRAPV